MLAPEDNAIACEKLLACKKALFIGAHPDDIEFRAGGLVYLMRQRGVEVTFAVATRGGKGWVWPFRNVLEWLRERHQRNAAKIMGGAEVLFLGYPDGRLPENIDFLRDDLRSLMQSRQPDVVLCWDPKHSQNPHRDHLAAALATQAACSRTQTLEQAQTSVRCTKCWYGSREPNVWVGFDEETMRVKIRALKAHRTETPWFYFDLRLKKRMIAAMRQEGSEIGSDYAETFRLTHNS